MKVSVIIAAYNIEEYIDRCLKSVINQTLKEIEIVVVNDGSTDRTLEKITKIAKNDERIVIVDQNNKGLIEARKSGLKVAKGEYLLFIDGDDWIEENALELLYNNAIDNNSDIVIYDAYLSFDNSKEKFDIICDFNLDEDDYIKNLFLNKVLPCIWSKFVKLDFLRKNKINFPSNISFGEDLATVSSWFMHKPKVSILNENLYHYYQRDASITKTKTPKVLEVDKAIKFIKDMLIENNLYDLYKKEFEYLVYVHQFNWFLDYSEVKDLNIKLYEQYSKRNININSNEIIKNKIDTYPLSLKMRVKSYHKSYKIGKLYDSIRGLIKSA